MRHLTTLILLPTALLAGAAATSPLAAQTYTSAAAFAAAAGAPTYTETFETVPVSKDTRYATFTKSGIKYTGQAGVPGPNVIVASPGYTNFPAVPGATTTSVLSANGDENILVEFLPSVYSVGFDAWYNGLGPNTTTFYNGATILGTITYNSAATIGFNGYIGTADTPITAMRWKSFAGAALNSGIDNIRIDTTAPEAVVATPEPASLMLLATGFFVISVGVRRRSRGNSAR